MSKINSMQAYQLAVALAPSFLSQLPQTSSQSNALALQLQTAQGGIVSETQKKALKDAKKGDGGIGKIADLAAMIPGPQQPFIMGANAIYKGTQGDYVGAIGAGMGAAGGFMDAYGGGGGGGGGGAGDGGAFNVGATPTNPFGQGAPQPVGTGTVLSSAQPASSPAFSMPVGTGTVLSDKSSSPEPTAPAGESKNGGGGGGRAFSPAVVAGLATGAFALNKAHKHQQEVDNQQFQIREAQKNIADPRVRGRIESAATASREDWSKMSEMQQMVTAGLMLDNGIPLTKLQSRAINPEIRRSLQATYGTHVVPQTTSDYFHNFAQQYNQASGSNRITPAWPGMDIYLP